MDKAEGLIRLKIDITRFLPGKKRITHKEADAFLMKLHRYLKKQNFIMVINEYKITTTAIYD